MVKLIFRKNAQAILLDGVFLWLCMIPTLRAVFLEGLSIFNNANEQSDLPSLPLVSELMQY